MTESFVLLLLNFASKRDVIALLAMRTRYNDFVNFICVDHSSDMWKVSELAVPRIGQAPGFSMG